MLIANDLLYQQFLEQRYQQSTEIVTAAGHELEQIQAEAGVENQPQGDDSVLGSLSRAWSSTVDKMDLSGRLARIQARAADVISHLIQLSVVFVLQTALLPVAFLWLFAQVIKRLFRPLGFGGTPDQAREPGDQ
jgi:hypothetical protein